MSRPPLLLATALLILWSASAGAQTDPTPPPLPQAVQGDAPASAPASTFPTLPIGSDGIRDVQSQLIALGFEPGAADGQAGPATVAAAQQYNENRGGSGPVPIDGALLARLQQDTGPRLTPEQVGARSQPHYAAPAPDNSFKGAIRQFGANIRSILPNGGN
jgi:hypothetical protein